MRIFILLLTFLTCLYTLFVFPIELIKASDMNPKKVVLILHGWPQPVEEGSTNEVFLKYFSERGYEIVAPRLFSKDFVLAELEARVYVEKQLGGRKPDVIVGISLGGLLAPTIVKDYPNAKLVFVASGAKMETKSESFKALLELAKKKQFNTIFQMLKFVPQRILFNIYELINPFRGDENQRKIYVEDMKKNFRYIISIPIEEEKEIIDFVNSVDNRELLKTLKNRSLIFSGRNDLMMSGSDGARLEDLLPNSNFIINDRGHFNVFTEANFKDLDKFLGK